MPNFLRITFFVIGGIFLVTLYPLFLVYNLMAIGSDDFFVSGNTLLNLFYFIMLFIPLTYPIIYLTCIIWFFITKVESRKTKLATIPFAVFIFIIVGLVASIFATPGVLA